MTAPNRRIVTCYFNSQPHPIDDECQRVTDVQAVTAPNPADAVAALAEASGDPEAFRLVYSALMQRYDDSCRVGHMTQFADEVAAHAVQVLRDAGRLLPPGTDTRTEHAVRMTWDDGSVTYAECDRRLAEASVAYHAKRRAEGPWRTVSADVVQRTVVTSVGPWVPVPTTPETP